MDSASADAENGVDQSKVVQLPTLHCLTEADRYRFSEGGTYAIRLISATIGPLTDASLCIENGPVQGGGCAQTVQSPFPAVWTRTVNSEHQLTMWASENGNGTGQLQTDCGNGNQPRSYATFHNPSHSAEFTFSVERVGP